MAINIGADVAKDIRRMVSQPEFYEKVVKRSAETHIKSAEDMTWITRAPNGDPFQGLSKRYRKEKYDLTANSKPDLRFQSYAIESMYTKESGSGRTAEVHFKRGSKYMYDHQYGDKEKKLPQRKIFPEEQDMSSTHQADNIRMVTNHLTTYLNQPRIIRGG